MHVRVFAVVMALAATQLAEAGDLETCRALVARKAHAEALEACEDLQYEPGAAPEAFYLLGVSHEALSASGGPDVEHHRNAALLNLRRYLDDTPPGTDATRRAAILALLRAEAAGETPDPSVLTYAEELAAMSETSTAERNAATATFRRHGRAVEGVFAVFPPPPPLPSSSPRPRSAPAPQPPLKPARRAGRDVPKPVLVKRVEPVVPAIARAARVQGDVILDCRIDARGKVEGVRILRGIPLLDEAAVDALRQWEFEPTVVDGKRVPVLMEVTIGLRVD